MSDPKRGLEKLKTVGKFSLMSLLVFFAGLALQSPTEDTSKPAGLLLAFWAFLCIYKWVLDVPQGAIEATSGSASPNRSRNQLLVGLLVLSLVVWRTTTKIGSQIESLESDVSSIESKMQTVDEHVQDTSDNVQDISGNVESISAHYN